MRTIKLTAVAADMCHMYFSYIAYALVPVFCAFTVAIIWMQKTPVKRILDGIFLEKKSIVATTEDVAGKEFAVVLMGIATNFRYSLLAAALSLVAQALGYNSVAIVLGGAAIVYNVFILRKALALPDRYNSDYVDESTPWQRTAKRLKSGVRTGL